MPILDTYFEHKYFRTQNHVTTKAKVTVSDYFTLVMFQFNFNSGLKENSKINNYVNLFYIIYLLYGKML